jgi:hypothetical protein
MRAVLPGYCCFTAEGLVATADFAAVPVVLPAEDFVAHGRTSGSFVFAA